jgi:hypothetical protein
MNNSITRNEILNSFIKTLENLDYVHAMWEGGAAAFNRLDEWSDIDLQFDVADDRVEDSLCAVEQIVETLSPSYRKYRVPQLPWDGLFQVFYQLQNASPYLLLDIVVMQHSAQEKLLQTEIHGKAVFYFDKNGVSQIPPFDWVDWKSQLRERVAALKITFPMFQTMVTKEIFRGNKLDALGFYHSCTLRPLIEILRILYKPARYNFYTRYVYNDMPPEVAGKLEILFFVTGMEDIQIKRQQAEDWFYQTIEQVEPILK